MDAFKGTNVSVQVEGSKDTGVEVVTTGARHLGAAVGTKGFQEECVRNMVHTWVECVKKLTSIAQTEPHAAYAAYTHCLQSQWTFLCRTMPASAAWFQP